jgi:hypothetical protein
VDRADGIAFGRRKFIPLLVAFGAISTLQVVERRLVVLNVVLLGWCVFFTWRYWVSPMPPRLAARRARVGLDGPDRFGVKTWHKIAIVFLALIAALFVALVAFATIHG